MSAKGHLTNLGKKEQRQFVKLLDKAVKEETPAIGPRPVEGRTVPKQHSLKKRRRGIK